MKAFCIVTEQEPSSVTGARACVESAAKVGQRVELFPSVHWSELDRVHRDLGLRRRLESHNASTTTPTHCPAFRMANGTTHFLLYERIMQIREPVCILEHDARFIARLPLYCPPGVIQVGWAGTLSDRLVQGCCRAKRMVREGRRPGKLPQCKGIVHHPLNALNGTAAYIIDPWGAASMVDFIRREGVAFADCVSREIVGTLLVVVPQCVMIEPFISPWHGR